jgi:hypothetical protein
MTRKNAPGLNTTLRAARKGEVAAHRAYGKAVVARWLAELRATRDTVAALPPSLSWKDPGRHKLVNHVVDFWEWAPAALSFWLTYQEIVPLRRLIRRALARARVAGEESRSRRSHVAALLEEPILTAPFLRDLDAFLPVLHRLDKDLDRAAYFLFNR